MPAKPIMFNGCYNPQQAGICEKLIYRHPHIYGDVVVNSEEEVKSNWEKLKLKEGKRSVLQGVPISLPALIKAIRIQDKVKGVGFDWSDITDVKAKVDEELMELQEAIASKEQDAVEDEFGDVLFSLVNYARFLQVNPEDALERTNRKFLTRFSLMEELIIADDKDLSSMDLEQMDVYWELSKKRLRNQ